MLPERGLVRTLHSLCVHLRGGYWLRLDHLLLGLQLYVRLQVLRRDALLGGLLLLLLQLDVLLLLVEQLLLLLKIAGFWVALNERLICALLGRILIKFLLLVFNAVRHALFLICRV